MENFRKHFNKKKEYKKNRKINCADKIKKIDKSIIIKFKAEFVLKKNLLLESLLINKRELHTFCRNTFDDKTFVV